jgi:D-aminoacyl-tRNA deacylase
MYKKYLIVASKLDKAGANITTQMSQFGQDFKFYLLDGEAIFDENLDKEKINQYDFIIFASKHQSEKGGKTLSIHAPGNFRDADFGGEKGKICKTSALFQKQFFEKLHNNVKKFNLEEYQITLECTHHGPLIDKPCLFVEIGSSENEWRDTKAAFVMAKTISEMISNFKENKYHEIAIGIGGPHYCPSFNKIQLHSNVAISHVIPQYVFPLTEEMIKEAIAKTEEEVDFFLLDWKGIGTSEQRQEMIKLFDKLYINYKKTSDVEK